MLELGLVLGLVLLLVLLLTTCAIGKACTIVEYWSMDVTPAIKLMARMFKMSLVAHYVVLRGCGGGNNVYGCVL